MKKIKMQVIDWEIFSMLKSNKRLNPETQKLHESTRSKPLALEKKQCGVGEMLQPSQAHTTVVEPRVWVPAPTLGSLQPSVTPTPGIPCPGLCNSALRSTYPHADTQEHISTCRYTGAHTYKWIHRSTCLHVDT